MKLRGLLLPLILLALSVRATPALCEEPPDRASVPSPGPIPPLHLPEVQRFSLSGGAELWVLESHELPLARVTLQFLLPEAELHPQALAAWDLIEDLLLTGTERSSALQIEDRLRSIGALFQIRSEGPSRQIAIELPSRHLTQGLELLRELVTEPSFSRAELRRVKESSLMAIREYPRNAASLLRLADREASYGNSHLLGLRVRLQDYRPFGAKRLKKHYQGFLRHAGLRVLALGDLRAQELLPQIEAAFGALCASVAPPLRVAPARSDGARVVAVEDPWSNQARVLLSIPALPPDHPRFPAVLLLNELFGGASGSRLAARLREELALTYGARSQVESWPGHSRIRAISALDPARLEEAITAMRQINEEFRSGERIRHEDLERAKRALLMSTAEGLDTLARSTEALAWAAEDTNDPLAWWRLRDRAREVQLDDLRATAQELFQEDRMTWVLMGAREEIETAAERAGLPPTALWSTQRAVSGPGSGR